MSAHRRKSHHDRKYYGHGCGNFPGGDPREFEPDEDCSTTEEREAYRLACESWDRGEKTPVAPACAWIPDADARALLKEGGIDSATIGGEIAHVTYTRFGLGGYRYREPMISRRDRRAMEREAAAWAEKRINEVMADAARRRAARTAP